MDVKRLRAETAADHNAVERLVPLMKPELSECEYVVALRAFFGFVSGWERWASVAVPVDLAAFLLARRRTPLLETDLRHFGQRVHDIPVASFGSTQVSRAQFLGAMYVLEGSTLGGRYIAAHTQQVLGLECGVGNAYFEGAGDGTGARWREFLALLADLPEADSDQAIASAKSTFASFGEWIQHAGGNSRSEARSEHV